MRIVSLSLLVALGISSSEAFAVNSLTSTIQRCSQASLRSCSDSNENANAAKGEYDSKSNLHTNKSITRRSILSAGAALLGSTLLTQPSNAGEVGARINKAVTQSDLGISVRRSVVKGAQMMDQIDGKWEKFSDDNGLGSERFKQQPRPKPREVPDLKPLNLEMAKQILELSDEAFQSSTGVSSNMLLSQIEQVDGKVRKSFERSGLDLSGGVMTPKAFNYYCYIHFKAYCDLIIDQKLTFNRKSFEGALG